MRVLDLVASRRGGPNPSKCYPHNQAREPKGQDFPHHAAGDPAERKKRLPAGHQLMHNRFRVGLSHVQSWNDVGGPNRI